MARMVKRPSFVSGLIIGFVTGSSAGRGPYERLQTGVRRFAGLPEVRQVVHQVKWTTMNSADAFINKFSGEMPDGGGRSGSMSSTGHAQKTAS